MIEITLKELNDSFQSLTTVAESLTAGKMKYRFARLLKAAKNELDVLADGLSKIAEKHGAEMIGNNRFHFDEVKQKESLIAFNFESIAFLKGEKIKLDFDTKYFTFDELSKAEDTKKPINAAVISDLLWLVSDGEESAGG